MNGWADVDLSKVHSPWPRTVEVKVYLFIYFVVFMTVRERVV